MNCYTGRQKSQLYKFSRAYVGDLWVCGDLGNDAEQESRVVNRAGTGELSTLVLSNVSVDHKRLSV